VEGLCRVFGSGVPISLEGKTIILPAMWLSDFGICENLLLSRRPKPPPSLAFGSGLKGSMRRHVRDISLQRIRLISKVSTEELTRWMDTDEGTVYTIWLCLRKDDAAWTFSRTRSAIEPLSEENKALLRQLRDQVCGLDLLAWSDWPSELDEELDGKDKKKKGMSWRRLFRALVEDGQIDPVSAGRMTIYQARVLTLDPKYLGGVQKMSVGEYKAMRAGKSAAKAGGKT
jgi:hypothetical protein